MRITFIYIAIIIAFIFGMYVLVNTMNADLYGRLIANKSIKIFNSIEKEDRTLPTITLILHRYLNDESSVEASIFISIYNNKLYLPSQYFYNDSILKVDIKVSDGYYIPYANSNSFQFTNNIKHNKNISIGFETNRFHLPVSHSLYGFPYDNIEIWPFIDVYINGNYCKFFFQVQKRIPGRLLSSTDRNDNNSVVLKRTPTEKCFVMISSVVFLALTVILTYSLLKTKIGLTKIEEVVAVAGYILATAGFRDLLGITRINGTCTLEIIVILVPLLSVLGGLVYSFFGNNHKT